ncbi:MAG: ShlB/FhaC/HecB family hemolysin secretion/activation protein [Candidatus Omnitrophica bacterium]|nr:ShlB/FhaC/HecB family hemolysin secretion/activation protein [Candidatus Omnitrophota bacterium]
MEKFKGVFGVFVCLGILCFSTPAISQQPPAAQTAGGLTRQEKEIETQKVLKIRIHKEKPLSGEESLGDVLIPDKGPKVFISKIVVEGAILLSEPEIRKIVAPFEGNDLSFKNMQKVTDLLTDEYRKKGYVTSRAYMPPQTIRDGLLIIRVVEGKLGELEIKGNRYFSSSLIKKKLGVEPGGYFDYSALQKSLVYVNEHPDRMAKAILVPGKEPGTTDLIVDVEDRLPFHVGFSYDNYGSRYIEENRYALTLEHNNLFGRDDKIYIKVQSSDSAHLVSQQLRYVYPVTSRWEVGGHLLFSELKLGQEFEDLDSRGEAEIYGIFTNYAIVEKDNLEVRLNFGFDVKDITNELSGVQLSQDELRVLKAGFEMDVDDRWGRTIFTAELDNGVPDFMGGMSSTDPDASRTGAGGEFAKGVFNLFRLHPTPFSTSLLLKNSFQVSGDTLAASEQFQIGGATSVRGYPAGEHSGDEGFYSAIELSLPFYGLSKDLKVPFRKDRLYDALRFVFFGDIGRVTFNNVQAGEDESKTLRSAGFGLRLTASDGLECRVEVGYPLGGNTPSDGDHAHVWVEFHWKI